jgi:hypothetical protein
MTTRLSRRLRLEELEHREVPSALGASDDLHAHKINSEIDAQLTSLTSTGGSTAGVVRTGLLRGTTHFSGTFTDAQGDYLGTLTISTAHGELTLLDQGNLNLATGQFSDVLTVIGGTDLFAGATGQLTDAGVGNLQTGSLVTTSFTGVIYLDR